MYWYWPPSQETLYTIAGVFAICGTGLLEIVRGRRELKQRREFATEFRSRFTTYANNPSQEFQTYTWLIANSPQMQMEMGGMGILEHFTDGRYSVTNYPIILNMLPTIRNAVDNDHRYHGLFRGDINKYFHMFDEALVCYLGSVNYRLTHSPSPWNPAILFREGIRQWIASPLMLLAWFGVLSTATVVRLTKHPAFKVLSGTVAVLGFIGTIFTIALGWGDMYKLILKWFGAA